MPHPRWSRRRSYPVRERPAYYALGRTISDRNNLEPKLYAYDKTTGRLLAEIPVPTNAGGAPMT